jgi:hypothetical protein
MSCAKPSINDAPRLSFVTVSVLSRPRLLYRFMAMGLVCEGIKKRADHGHPNSKSDKKVQQKIVENVRVAVEIASK